MRWAKFKKKIWAKKYTFFGEIVVFLLCNFFYYPRLCSRFHRGFPHNILTAAEKSRRKNKMGVSTKPKKIENWSFLIVNCSFLVRSTEILFGCVESSFIRCSNTFYLKVLAICIKKIYSNCSGSLFEFGLPKRVWHFHI